MQAEAIYKGATRPAMKMGIPLVPLVALFGTGMLLVLWVGTLLTWWIVPIVLVAFVPVLAWMRFVTRKDDQRFRQMFVALKLRIHDRNRRFWRSRSYSPYLHRSTIDGSLSVVPGSIRPFHYRVWVILRRVTASAPRRDRAVARCPRATDGVAPR